MSFNIHFMAFRDGEAADADQRNARAFVDSLQSKMIGNDVSARRIILTDGASVELYASGLYGGDKPFRGAMVSLHSISESICEFLFDFAKASSCIALPVMDPSYTLVPCDQLTGELPEELNDIFPVVQIRSAIDVGLVLKDGYYEYARYRDRIQRELASDKNGTEQETET